jgi:hypothetical protein
MAGRVAQVVECLPTKSESRVQTLASPKNKKEREREKKKRIVQLKILPALACCELWVALAVHLFSGCYSSLRFLTLH